MPCYTKIEVTVDDTAINRRARKNLKLPEEGKLSESQARAVKVEASVLTARDKVLRLNPTAVITRKGNTLSVIVQSG